MNEDDPQGGQENNKHDHKLPVTTKHIFTLSSEIPAHGFERLGFLGSEPRDQLSKHNRKLLQKALYFLWRLKTSKLRFYVRPFHDAAATAPEIRIACQPAGFHYL